MARIAWFSAAAVAALVLPLVARAAAPVCASCHAREAQALARSAMGRSFRLAQSSPAPDAAFLHAPSQSRAAVQGLRHLIDGQGHEVRFAVGSGRAGTSFLIDRGGWLFQSPLSYYAARPDRWGVSPGYERDAKLDFSRAISEDCVFCHAGTANFVKGSLNRFASPPAEAGGIACERCHGPGGPHAANPAAHNIVNPARLADPTRRAAICEQCHLSGEARIWNRGKGWRDLVPGRSLLEDALTVYEGHVQGHQAERNGTLVCRTCAWGLKWNRVENLPVRRLGESA